MKKVHLALALLVFGGLAQAQSFFIKSGKNYTKLAFTNRGINPIDIHTDLGNTYELGYDFKNQSSGRFGYRLGLQLDEYNSYVAAPINKVAYNTQYLGLNNAILISVFNGDKNRGRVKIDVKGGLNMSMLVSGKQEILGKINNLNSHKDFNGLFLATSLGLETKYIISDDIHFSLGYDRVNTFTNTGNRNNQTLSFQSNQYKIGIHFLVN